VISYLVQWGHMYVIHVGAIFAFVVGAKVWKGDVDTIPKVWELFKVAFVLSVVLAVLTSHSHTHYQHLLGKVLK